MKVCKCDRCGEIFEPYKTEYEWISRVIQVGTETFGLEDVVGEIKISYDICDKCYDGFLRWMRRGTFKKVTLQPKEKSE